MARHLTDEEALEIGRRQSLFRDVNERIDELAERFDLLDQVPLICECASAECNEQIELTHAEYEALRRIPTHFAVLPGHDVPDVERVVEQNERFVTVEKFGESARAAIKLDPRRRNSGTESPCVGRSSSGKADAWVNHGVEQVDCKIEDDDADRCEDDSSLHSR